MREIKFRGQRKSDKAWVYGCYQRLVIDGVMRHFILPANSLVFEDIKLINALSKVAPETVGQFTGLTDKNGKEIYDGDIVKTEKYIGGNFVENEYNTCQVIFMNYSFQLKPIPSTIHTYSLVGIENIEVIGNIHDNLELLKQ